MTITTEQLLAAYANGYFPMGLSRKEPELYWFSPEERGVLPLDGFHIPRGLKRALKSHPYTLTVDRAFEDVLRGCAAAGPKREDSWINDTIAALYIALHHQGFAHSIEVWTHTRSPLEGEQQSANPQDEARCVGGKTAPNSPHGSTGAPLGLVRSPSRVELTLVGGLYGVSLGGAFFGESMFSTQPDASKIALATLVEILNEAGYQLLDTQYVNDHLKQFGVVAMPKADYMTKLENALSASPNPSSLFSTVSVRKGLASSSSASET